MILLSWKPLIRSVSNLPISSQHSFSSAYVTLLCYPVHSPIKELNAIFDMCTVYMYLSHILTFRKFYFDTKPATNPDSVGKSLLSLYGAQAPCQ